MGASAREIEQEIKKTRDRMDENLAAIKRRAKSNAVRVGQIVAVGSGLAVALVGGFLLYRRIRRPTLQYRLKGVSSLPRLKVAVNEKSEEAGTVESILRKVGPGLVGTASTALLERVARRPDRTEP